MSSGGGLVDALACTFSPDKAQRDVAEKWLADNACVEGFVSSLLEIVSKPDADYSIRQAAGVSMKNVVKKHWQPREEDPAHPVIGPADRTVLKENLVAVIVTLNDKSLRSLATAALICVARHDYPDQWPGLLGALATQLISQDTAKLYNACYILRHVTKLYEFKPEEQRAPLNALVEGTFPSLERIFEAIIHLDEPGAADLMKLISKIFWSAVQLRLPNYVMKPEAINKWLGLLNQVVARDVDALGMPEDPEERARWPWWKAKKWACQIFSRIFSRFGHPKFTDDVHKGFTTYWVQNLAATVTETMLKVLTLRCQGRYCSDRVVQLGLDFLETGLELATTFKLIKPHIEGIISQVIFPVLIFNDADATLWADDPHEYCRKSYDTMEEFYDPRMSAVNFLNTSIKLRTKTCLPPIVQFFGGIMQEYQKTPLDARSEALCRRMEGAMGALGACQMQLSQHPKYFPEPETMLLTYVFSEFRSPRGYLRARTCWMLQQFAAVEFADEASLRQALQALLQCLADPELPVQMQAATAIKYVLMESAGDMLEEVMIPVLPDVLGRYFDLMGEIGIDEVVSALRTIIGRLDEHVAPHALQIAIKLTESFSKYAGAGDADGEADDEAALAAMNCMDAINTLLLAVGDQPKQFPELEGPILPLLARMMEPDGIEYLEQTLQALSCFTFYSDITASQWSFFPRIMTAFYGWGNDYVKEFSVPLDNFVSRATEVFLGGTCTFCTAPLGTDEPGRQAAMVTCTFREAVLRMAQRVLESREAATQAVIEMARLLATVLHSCRGGRVDDLVPLMLGMVLKRINTEGLRNPGRLQVALMTIVASALHYNPILTLGALEKLMEGHKATIQVFHMWLQTIPNHSRIFDKKQAALGLTALLQIPLASLPAPLREGADQIIFKTIELMSNLVRQRQEAADADEGDDDDGDDGKGEDAEDQEEDEEDDGDGEAEDFDDEKDVVDGEEEEYMKQVMKMRQEIQEQQFRLGVGGDYEEELLEEQEEDDEEFISPLDDVDELVFFHDVLAAASARDGDVFAAVYAKLPGEVQEAGQQLVGLAAQKKTEAAAKLATAAAAP